MSQEDLELKFWAKAPPTLPFCYAHTAEPRLPEAWRLCLHTSAGPRLTSSASDHPGTYLGKHGPADLCSLPKGPSSFVSLQGVPLPPGSSTGPPPFLKVKLGLAGQGDPIDPIL